MHESLKRIRGISFFPRQYINSSSVFLAILTIVLGFVIVLSFQWRMVHDSPIMFYLAYLIDHFGFVPYRDVFDMNMPGTYFIYIIIERVFGYGDFGFRIADITILLFIFLMTWLTMKEFGHKVAWASCVLFGSLYLSAGSNGSLQRDYFVVFFLSAALFVLFTFPNMRVSVRSVFIGLIGGFSLLVKPQSFFVFPLFIIYLFVYTNTENERRGRFQTIVIPSLIGVFLPLFLTVWYLYYRDGLNNFIEIIENYWPLYSSLNYQHQIILSGQSRLEYLFLRTALMGGRTFWILPAFYGMVISLLFSHINNKQKQKVILLSCVTLVFLFYPTSTGQFWPYHWFPFLYAISLLGALCFINRSQKERSLKQFLPIVIFGCALYFSPLFSGEFRNQIKGVPLEPPKGGKVDEIAGFLINNMGPEDTVQPLDWTGGAIHAMLIAKAKIATPFIYDFHFYHHISNPYIHKLRERFISSLHSSWPRYIIAIIENKPWVSGPNTTQDFKELFYFLKNNYNIVVQGKGYYIMERSQQNKAG